MNTHYTPRSKYYRSEVAFRSKYPTARIERHYYRWRCMTAKDYDVVACELLGYVGGASARRNSMYWIVARESKSQAPRG